MLWRILNLPSTINECIVDVSVSKKIHIKNLAKLRTQGSINDDIGGIEDTLWVLCEICEPVNIASHLP